MFHFHINKFIHPFNKVLNHYKLQKINIFTDLDNNDATIYLEIPEIAPLSNTPSNSFYFLDIFQQVSENHESYLVKSLKKAKKDGKTSGDV